MTAAAGAIPVPKLLPVRPRGRPEPAAFMITEEKYAHRRFFFRDHAERRG
jgi:hypothetical protein